MPSDAELERDVREALRVANMDEMSLKVIRKQLEVKWQVDLSSKKAFLKEMVTSIMAEGQEEEEEEEEEEGGEEEGEEAEEEEEGEEEEEVVKPKKPKRADFQVSPALYEFLGRKEEFMARGDVTKAVWAYIRAESLQDPKDGRKIRNDDKMFRVFKCKTMSMMQIAKKLSPHLKKYSDLVGAEAGGGGGGGKRD